ncbi:MAG: GNAT family N-acetyltransferase [Bacteroidota bacterium]|jgi:ribosomal protein S18 acetylase RimI-like enzyme
MQNVALHSGGLSLRRARDTDRAAVLTLQRAAYARNRELLGCEPLPLLADYAQIFTDYEVWVAEQDGIAGALILEPRSGDLLIWSIATDPARQRAGLGKTMLAAAETRARRLGLSVMRLYTGATLQHLIDWYGRHGYTVERIEQLSDRAITHMMKRIATN